MRAINVATNRLSDGRRALWCWLAGRTRQSKNRNTYWATRYKKSVAVAYGIEVSQFTRWLAQTIDDIDLQHLAIKKELFTLVYDDKFHLYNLVFDQFNFNLTLRALLLSQVYPSEKFESMAAFKKRVGAAKDDNSSGDVNMHLKGGSKLCRTEFYLWVTTNIANKKNRPQSNVGQIISNKYDDWVTQFESNNELRQQQLAIKTHIIAIKSMQAIVSSNFKPSIDGNQLTNQLAMMETLVCC